MIKKQILEIAEILELGSPKESNGNLQMLCPFHLESKESFGIDFNTGACHCFACGEKSHILNLANALKGQIIPIKLEDVSKYKVKTLIDGIGYTEKPKDKINEIIERIDISENFKEYSIYDLIFHIIKGHTIVPSGKRTEKEWAEQQIVMLDFDNKETHFTRDEVFNYSKEINLQPTFCYYTFSNTCTKPKFRFVYCFESPIQDKSVMQQVINELFRKFKFFNPDLQCKHLASKFLGTNNPDVVLTDTIYRVNNRFTKEQLDSIDLLFNHTEKKSNNKINSISVKSLLETQLPPLNIIIENMLTQGLTILASSPKVGKSWACLDLCISICKGIPFLGFKTNKNECLYLALEDSNHRLQNRIKKILGNEEIPTGFNLAINCSPLDNGFIEELENYLKDFPNTKLIIIDTLQKIRGNINKTDTCYSYDYKEIGKLKAFADKHRICILVIHHLRKAKDSDVFNQISGSTGLTGAADTMITFSKLENNNEKVLLSITGRDVENTEKTITFNKEKFKWELADVNNNVEKEFYNLNPIIITIKKLLEVNPEGFKISASELLKNIYSFTKTNIKQNSPQSLTRELNENLRPLLSKYDGIYYEAPSKNGGSTGRKMSFAKPQQTQ